MAYCPKCGSKTREDMNFCPKCGAQLKIEKAEAPAPTPTPPAPVRVEKEEKRENGEKGEKQEQQEKEERYEKRQSSFIGPLIGGFILIFAGLAFYTVLTTTISWQVLGAIFFVIIGIIVIAGAVYAAATASRRHPRT